VALPDPRRLPPDPTGGPGDQDLARAGRTRCARGSGSWTTTSTGSSCAPARWPSSTSDPRHPPSTSAPPSPRSPARPAGRSRCCAA